MVKLRHWLSAGILVLSIWCWGTGLTWAASLGDRLSNYPDWQSLPSLDPVQSGEDLMYPEWFEGTWGVSSTLLDQVAPLAPEIVTPGFAQSEHIIGQPVTFAVRFIPHLDHRLQVFMVPRVVSPEKVIVADRAFNGMEIARAYLGPKAIQSVQVDPDNPNRQLTTLANDHHLISTVTNRVTEQTNATIFASSELTQQQFQGDETVYLNRVETTTRYYRANPRQINANQVTAVYLSPSDPDYFHAQNHPVALYHYHLKLTKS